MAELAHHVAGGSYQLVDRIDDMPGGWVFMITAPPCRWDISPRFRDQRCVSWVTIAATP